MNKRVEMHSIFPSQIQAKVLRSLSCTLTHSPLEASAYDGPQLVLAVLCVGLPVAAGRRGARWPKTSLRGAKVRWCEASDQACSWRMLQRPLCTSLYNAREVNELCILPLAMSPASPHWRTKLNLALLLGCLAVSTFTEAEQTRFQQALAALALGEERCAWSEIQ